MSEKTIKVGYKVTDSAMKCRGFQFELNKNFKIKDNPIPCKLGFHYCSVLADCFRYYPFDPNNRVFEIEDNGETAVEGDKSCTNNIKFIREISWLEVLNLVNTGKGNNGIDNAGNKNAGYYNAGNKNAGYYNAGNKNAGYYNAGNDNAGNRNAGNRNAGNRNAGNDNAGNDNAGYYNAGNYNAGNRNAGYSNAGNDNAGAFNNLQANYMMFNKPSNWTYEDFINSNAYSLMSDIEFQIYVPFEMMNEEEIKSFPKSKTTGHYYKQIPYKEAWQNAWNNWSESSRQAFKDLPNFDKEIFKDITGIDV